MNLSDSLLWITNRFAVDANHLSRDMEISFIRHTRLEPCSAPPTTVLVNVYDFDCGIKQAISCQLEVMPTQIVDVCG
jgi:hypothetical protein